MHHLTARWPLGLRPRNAWLFGAAFVVMLAALYPVDRQLSVWAKSMPPAVRIVFQWVTILGESGWPLVSSLIALTGGGLLALVSRDAVRQLARRVIGIAGFVFLGVGLPALAATALKRLVGRARPQHWSAETPLSFSPLNWNRFDYQGFPSGHTTTAFALAIVIAFLWPRAARPALILAALIAVSRVVLGDHYPTDVVAGAAIGTLGAYAVRNFFVSRGWLFESTATGEVVRLPPLTYPQVVR